MFRYTRVALVLFTWLAALHSTAYAQAAIAGLVRDISGGVLPGVTVEAASPALIENVRSVVTDQTGRYRIDNLRPGIYTVTFTLPGFATIRHEGIQLTGTFVASVNADLRVGTLEETVTVTGEAPVVDVQSTVRQQVMDREILDTIPMGRSDRDLATLVPATISDRVDVGGSATTVSGRAVVHGSRGSSQRVLQNGLSVGVPFDGASSSQQANLAAYQEVTIDTAAFDAEHETGGTRVNLIPRDGGNAFTGTFFGTFATEDMQGDNYTQDLKDRGLTTPSVIRNNFDINPGLGGPILRERLWFFTVFRYNGSSQFPADTFVNKNANNPNVWTYEPDVNSRPFIDSWWKDGSARFTWQVTPRNKVGLMYRHQSSCYCPEAISAGQAPEAGQDRRFPSQSQPAVDWTFPATNRLLFEAGALRFRSPTNEGPFPDQNPLMIRVEDQALNLAYRGRSGEQRFWTLNLTNWYRAAVSYITGAHTVKAGVTGGGSPDYTQAFSALPQPVTYRFNNGVPNQITLTAAPRVLLANISQVALYAQHRWTIDRVTLNYGLRYDHFTNNFPAIHLGPGPLVPNRNVTIPALDPGVVWHDLSPRTSLAYDLFGDGKTALKVTLSRYLEGQGGARGVYGLEMSPVARLITGTNRSWNDRDGNFVPDCDLTRPEANGECGGMSDPNFGTTVPGATYDRDGTHGWNKRDFNWELSAGVQREVLPRTSVDVTYFRRWYGNFAVVDDRNLNASDFETFSITAPVDPRLPGGGGYVVGGLNDLKPEAFGRPGDLLITRASNFGKQTLHWNGVDVTLKTRPRAGVLLQGGLSTGRTTDDKCDIVGQVAPVSATSSFSQFRLGNYNPSQLYCHVQTKFLTQVKFLGAYTIPRVDAQVSGTFRTEGGPEIAANHNVPTTEVARTLGRPLAGGARNVTVNLVEPGTMYGERLNQLDLRITKIFRMRQARLNASLDIFNVFNASTVLSVNNTFGRGWLTPRSIISARFIKLGVQFDF